MPKTFLNIKLQPLIASIAAATLFNTGILIKENLPLPVNKATAPKANNPTLSDKFLKIYFLLFPKL